MEKQIEKNQASLKKVHEGIERCLNGEFVHGEQILQILYKRERILEKTRKKLIKINRKSLISWEDPQSTYI